MRRRNPGDTFSTVAVLAALGVGAYYVLPRILPQTVAAPTPPSQPVNGAGDLVLPPGIKGIMLNCWAAKGKPVDKASWVNAMQTCALPLPSNVWGYVYDQFAGSNIQNGVPADENKIIEWLRYAWQQRGVIVN